MQLGTPEEILDHLLNPNSKLIQEFDVRVMDGSYPKGRLMWKSVNGEDLDRATEKLMLYSRWTPPGTLVVANRRLILETSWHRILSDGVE